MSNSKLAIVEEVSARLRGKNGDKFEAVIGTWLKSPASRGGIILPPEVAKLVPKDWDVLEDCGFDPSLSVPANLEFVSFVPDGQNYVNGEEMVRLARERRANFGLQHGAWLLEHEEEIPEGCDFIPLPGTILRDPAGDRGVADLHRYRGRWNLHFHYLADGWHRNDRLLRPRKS